jgi:uncharacterized protein (TIGR00290 family)
MLPPEVLAMQAEAMGIPLVQWWSKGTEYNTEFKKMLAQFRKEGITGGVFGDVSIGNCQASEHKQWIESVCQPMGITPYLPLWDQSRESLLTDLIDSGFEIIIVAVDDECPGKSWLGQRLDKGMLAEMKVRHQLSPTGDVGYYHTFVVDGPIFKKRLEIVKSEAVRHYDVWYLDILKCRLQSKASAEPAPAEVEVVS